MCVAVAVFDFLAFATFVDVVAFVLVAFVLDVFVLVAFVLVTFVTVLVVLVLVALLLLVDVLVLATVLELDVLDGAAAATTPLTQYAVFAHKLSHAASIYVFQLWNCAKVMLCAVSTL